VKDKNSFKLQIAQKLSTQKMWGWEANMNDPTSYACYSPMITTGGMGSKIGM